MRRKLARILTATAILMLQVPATDAAQGPDVAALVRAVTELQANNQALSARLSALETGAALARAPGDPALSRRISALEQAGEAQTARLRALSDEKRILEQRLQELELAQAKRDAELVAAREDKARLEHRIAELEAIRGASGPAPRPGDADTRLLELQHRVAQLEQTNAAQTRVIAAISDENAKLVSHVEYVATLGTEPAEVARLKQRVDELEQGRAAQEDATRLIIQDAMTSVGSNINESVALGGTLEVASAWTRDFDGSSAGDIVLNTAELDLEIVLNDWVLGGMVLEYDDGKDVSFISTSGFEESVERFNLDTAFIQLGNPQRFPPYLIAGRIVLPFGISTGNPVADVLTIEDPLTISGFEQRQVAVGFGMAWPTPAPAPQEPVVIPPILPQVIAPAWSKLLAALGTEPPKTYPAAPTPVLLPPQPPTWNVGIYSYNGDTFDRYQSGWRPDDQIDATVGYRTAGHCGKPYEELTQWSFCPWTVDIDVDYNSSVFDSRFLRVGYRQWLGDIGFVPGMAASLKTTFGPISLIGEWNGAVGSATFQDDAGVDRRISPSAWQASLGYQLDWNPWMEAVGAQGTYLALSYSESRDFQGVQRLIGDELTRVGYLPKRRLQIGAGEWFMEGVKLAVEFSRDWDYPQSRGGTGRAVNGVFTSLTYVW